eukprot:jgi/Bigna1/89716/estExt_fgenesh1_pg.C_540067
MGLCSSAADDPMPRESKGSAKATVREIRERLEEVFGMLDKDGSGEITFLEATKFLEKSKRNLRASDAVRRKTQQKQIENEVRKIFAMVDIDHTKKISADEFIAVYTNVFYPQQLSYKEFNRELRKIFGRLIEHYNENVERNTSRRNKFNTSGRPNEAPVDSRNGNNDHHALMKARHHHHASV